MGRTRTRTAAELVLDADALIALDRGDKRMIADTPASSGAGPVLSSARGVVAQAWRNGRVQVTLARSCEPRKRGARAANCATVIRHVRFLTSDTPVAIGW